jgi:hypothetical protein
VLGHLPMPFYDNQLPKLRPAVIGSPAHCLAYPLELNTVQYFC